MKTTGIIRSMDDLGRIVIPKSIRKKLNYQEGDGFEFFIEGNSIICTPHLTDSEKKRRWIANYAKQALNDSEIFIHTIDNNIVIVCNGDSFILTYAKPHSGDKYDFETGVAVAYAKYLGETIPEYI